MAGKAGRRAPWSVVSAGGTVLRRVARWQGGADGAVQPSAYIVVHILPGRCRSPLLREARTGKCLPPSFRKPPFSPLPYVLPFLGSCSFVAARDAAAMVSAASAASGHRCGAQKGEARQTAGEAPRRSDGHTTGAALHAGARRQLPDATPDGTRAGDAAFGGS